MNGVTGFVDTARAILYSNGFMRLGKAQLIRVGYIERKIPNGFLKGKAKSFGR